MEKNQLAGILLCLTVFSPCFSQNSNEVFPKRIQEQLQLKNREIDTEAKTTDVVFRQMERYVFDEEGREIFYEDLSSRDGFPVFDERNRNSITFRINDKSRTSTYDKMGNKTSSLIERYGEDPIQWQREYDKNNKLIHSKGHPDDKRLSEVWYDSEGRITHAIYSDGEEEWFAFDKEGRIISEKSRTSKDSPINETKRKYDKNGNLLSEVVKYGSEIEYSLTNKYDKNGNLLYSIEKDYDSIKEVKCNYNKDGLITSTSMERRYYEDDTYKKLLPETERESAEYSYDEKGRLIKKSEVFSYEEEPEDDGQMDTTYIYNEEGKLIKEVATGFFTNTPEDNFTLEKDYYYKENGNYGYTTSDGQIFEFYPDGKKAIETENERNTYWYDTEGREIHWQTKENGILRHESFYAYDDFGEESNVKGIDYDKEGNFFSDYELTTERDSEGRIIHYKAYESRGSVLDNHEEWYEYDSHGNQIFYKQSRPTCDDYIFSCEYQYDEKGNVTFYKDSEKMKWVKYDEHSFPTYLKLKSYHAGGFFTYNDKAFYTEFFFINKYSFHKNGRVKECVRYYFENPNYHQNGDYSLVLERQPNANE
ncbi:MAG: hypothetical protein J5930_03100 [Treponema sp.]|nr:hypothetical protein [Treponema sp.]